MLQACDVAIEDSSERVIDLMVQLLKDFTSSAVVTPNEFEKVCYCSFNNVKLLQLTLSIDTRSTNNSNNVGSMCNMSGQCAWPGLQLNYFLHSSSSHNRMGDQFSWTIKVADN